VELRRFAAKNFQTVENDRGKNLCRNGARLAYSSRARVELSQACKKEF
jgi:hypothetical protein